MKLSRFFIGLYTIFALVFISACCEEETPIELRINGEWVRFEEDYVDVFNFSTNKVERCIQNPGNNLNEYFKGFYLVSEENILDISFDIPELGGLYTYFMWSAKNISDNKIIFKDLLKDIVLFRVDEELTIDITQGTVSLENIADKDRTKEIFVADSLIAVINIADWCLQGLSEGVTYMKVSDGNKDIVLKLRVMDYNALNEACYYIKAINALKSNIHSYFGEPDLIQGDHYIYQGKCGKVYLDFDNDYGRVENVLILLKSELTSEIIINYFSEHFDKFIGQNENRSYFVNNDRSGMIIYDHETHRLYFYKK